MKYEILIKPTSKKAQLLTVQEARIDFFPPIKLVSLFQVNQKKC